VSPFAALPSVSTIHDVSFFVGPEWFPPKDRFLLRKNIPATVRRVKRVITVSETSKREIESWIPGAKGKVRVTLNACPSWISRIERENAARVVSEAVGVKQPFLLTVGTRWPRKNMELAIRAADLLGSDLPHKLLVTGKTGWGNAELGRRGIATGYVTNDLLSALYSAADLYIAPSKHEGFGIPLLEAFRCGCPVICSSGGALPEVAGNAALVEDNWEPEGWASSIDRLLRNKAKLAELAQLGFKREMAFSWSKTAEATEAVYREVIP
jgi:glycosyltransferase involved in cell wall biosynthesis